MGMISPIEPQIVSEFAQGLEDIVVVEEKRGFMETLLRDTLYNDPARPAIYGKVDAHGQPFMHIDSELQVDEIALAPGALSGRKARPRGPAGGRARWLEEVAHREDEDIMSRLPYFCSGCPHKHLHRAPRRRGRRRGRRLFRDGGVDGPGRRLRHPDGGRGRLLDGHLPVHGDRTLLPEHGGWHLLSLRQQGAGGGGRFKAAT